MPSFSVMLVGKKMAHSGPLGQSALDRIRRQSVVILLQMTFVKYFVKEKLFDFYCINNIY